VDDEEATLGARCVAAPILGADRGAIAAVSVSGPITRITVSHVSALARVVMNAAGAISTAMGFPPVELRAAASASSEKSGNSRK
jgi:IclR family transcriptional regulator, acetate operon repressor